GRDEHVVGPGEGEPAPDEELPAVGGDRLPRLTPELTRVSANRPPSRAAVRTASANAPGSDGGGVPALPAGSGSGAARSGSTAGGGRACSPPRSARRASARPGPMVAMVTSAGPAKAARWSAVDA